MKQRKGPGAGSGRGRKKRGNLNGYKVEEIEIGVRVIYIPKGK